MKKNIKLLLLVAMATGVMVGCSDNSSSSNNKKLGFNPIIRENVPEGPECREVAENLADTGCKVVFADSFGHEDYMIEAAKKHPTVQFCHATGTKAAAEKLANYHNAFASIYEGRYLAGVVAGMKLQAMKAADASVASKIGYVAAHPYAEVMSGYTSFYLGVKSIVEDVTMDVKYHQSLNSTCPRLIRL